MKMRKMKSNPLVSFIIPTHNASKTIEESVASIFCELKDPNLVEVIIIENASTDDTIYKCLKLMNKYKNVYLYRTKKGVSNARNEGLKQSNGKWIVFLDADDYIVSGMVNNIIIDAKSNRADLFIYGYESGNTRIIFTKEAKLFKSDNLDCLKIKMLKNPTKFMTVWAKLFKKELIIKNDIFFNSQLRLAEDGEFLIRFNKVCRKVLLKPESIYHYSINSSSTVHNFDGKKSRDYVYALEAGKKAIASEKESVKEAYLFYVLMHLNLLMVHEVFSTKNTMVWGKKIESLKNICQLDIFIDSIKNLKIRQCSNIRMIPVLLVKLHCYNLAAVLFKLRSWQNKKKELADTAK
ncbi:MAG: glycosyltransferase [Liquorilactobacillus nagelii]|jgi:glycosyltransferase involved in cell wall biosynthesis|uniref:glycosyltransferase family 2 protein n=1 Tax=Liquorilactobacillus nagelii TaxID=82688 RepID=UPI002432877B|nr:glycosyltransferase [Liquorilactobacillus nagelii]MCI1921429.1 glycosyltransferase [Liquorilactobacillus nagelii]MCI1977914.1 glycosyltransferase [Liquorilactobacillus nagelii]